MKSRGRVVAAGCIVIERIETDGRVATAGGEAEQRVVPSAVLPPV